LKKSVLVLILAVILTLYPVRNFITLANTEGAETTSHNEAEEYLRELYDYDIKKAQSNVKKASNLRNDKGAPTNVEINKIIKKLDEGKTTYRKIFKDVYIVGDSLMNGLECYNILNSNRLITQVSASLYHLSGNVKKIVKASPDAAKLVKAIKAVIFVLAGFMVLSQLGIASAIVDKAFTIAILAVAVAFALAFGLGGKDFAKKLLDKAGEKKEQ